MSVRKKTKIKNKAACMCSRLYTVLSLLPVNYVPTCGRAIMFPLTVRAFRSISSLSFLSLSFQYLLCFCVPSHCQKRAFFEEIGNTKGIFYFKLFFVLQVCLHFFLYQPFERMLDVIRTTGARSPVVSTEEYCLLESLLGA